MSPRRLMVPLLFLFLLCCQATAGPLRYRVDVLDPLPGGRFAIPTDINDLGQVVGYVEMPGTGNIAYSRPVIWDRSSTPTLLWDDGFVPGYKGGKPLAINNQGVIVGKAQGSSYTGTPLPGPVLEVAVPFAWTAADGLQRLVSTAEYGPVGEAVGINDSGFIVGNLGGPSDEHHAVVWSPDGGVDLVPDCQTYYCNAQDINEAGQVVGWYPQDNGYRQAFFWDSEGGFSAILGAESIETQAYAINDKGLVVGRDSGTLTLPAGVFAWDTNAEFRYLSDADGSRMTWLTADLNNRGQVIGLYGSPNPGYVTVIWDANDGARALDSLVTDDRDWKITYVVGINNAGQIVGRAFDGINSHGVVLTPVPEPSALCLAAAGIACVLFVHTQHKGGRNA